MGLWRKLVDAREGVGTPIPKDVPATCTNSSRVQEIALGRS